MKNWKLLNEKGEIIDSVNSEDSPGENYIDVEIIVDFINPICVDGKTFIEGADENQINEFLENKIKELNEQFKSEMEDTDGYVLKYIETGEEVPKDISELRNAIRQKYDDLKNEIRKNNYDSKD